MPVTSPAQSSPLTPAHRDLAQVRAQISRGEIDDIGQIPPAEVERALAVSSHVPARTGVDRIVENIGIEMERSFAQARVEK